MFLLKFTPPVSADIGRYSKINAEPWFFVRAGDRWPGDPSKSLIDATTQDRSQARVFASEEDARAQLAACGMPPGWDAEVA